MRRRENGHLYENFFMPVSPISYKDQETIGPTKAWVLEK